MGRFLSLVGAGVFSASQTGLLAYQTGGNAAEWQLTWFDRAGRPTLGDPRAYFDVEFSPDGRTVIFNSTRKGHYDLYRKPANGAGPEELVYADGTDKVPVIWSRDGAGSRMRLRRGHS